MVKFTGITVVAVIGCTAIAQTPRPQFDVADVRLNTSGVQEMTGGDMPGGQFSVRGITMDQLVKLAYNVHVSFTDTYVVGAPSWFRSDRYDVLGKAPPNTSEATLNLMLQSLLEREFKLTMHQEQRPMNVYVLTVKGKAKLTKAAGNGEPGCKSIGPQGPAAGGRHAACTNVTLADLADELPDLAGAYFDRPVLDQTGIRGAFDFKLDWVGRRQVDNGGLTIFDAIEKQLGLKVESRKAPVPVYMIDHVERLAAQ